MFGRETWRLAAFLVVFSVTQGNFTNLTEMEYEFDWACSNPKMRSSKTADELIKGNVSAKNRFVVEYAEFNEPPLLRKFQEKHFVNYKALEGNDFEMTEVSNKSVVISKCCPWNSYFDMDVYNCVEFQEEKLNVTSPQLLIGRLINYENATNYVFVESVPNCGNRSVASVRILSQVHVNDSGLSINGTFFPDYCLDEHPDRPNQTIVVTCHDPQVFCKDKTCFRKCCPLKQSYGPSGRKCQRTNNSFQPEFFDFPSLNRNEFARPFQFGIFFGHACEKRGKYLLDESEGETSFLDLTGTLYVPLYKKCFLRDDFCVEHVVFGNYSGIGSFLCFANESSDFQKSHLEYLLQSLGLILSSTFLFITLLVYLFSPKSQTLYGKTLMCYIACLFVAYLLLAVVNLKSTGLSKNSCAYIGYCILFLFLAAFFWLNIISFDIWKTFRVVRSLERTKSDKNQTFRFLWYSIYAWIFPCVITALCSLANEMPDFPFDAIKPDIGEERCWFSRQKYGIYVFFIVPISLVITCNIFFYVQTAWRIWRVKADIAKMEKHKRKKFAANKDRFLINGKLFIVMGLTWSLDILSFFAPHPVWYIADTANILHGVFIFAAFVLKKKVLRQISQQIRHPLKNMREKTSLTPTSNLTTKNSPDSTLRGTSRLTASQTISKSDSSK